MSKPFAKVNRSETTYTVSVSSTPPFSGSITVWHLRDFLAAIDAAGIPDEATLVADHSHDTRHFVGLRVSHLFVVEEAAE